MHTPTTSISARHRAQLTVSGVTVLRGPQRVLNDVDLVVTPISRIGIVGENGRGKTTLLHTLEGSIQPDEGTVHRIGTLAIAEQEMEADAGSTVGDAVARAIARPLAALAALDTAAAALAGGVPAGGGSASADSAAAESAYAEALETAQALDAWDAERRVTIALEALGAETDMRTPLDRLSVGQRYRVRLACLLGADDDFLLLDEPTNHLDRSGLEFLTAQIRQRAGGVVFVSHDRALLADAAETIIDLDPTPDNRLRVYGNGYAGYREGRLAERARWDQAYEQQRAEAARLQESLSQAQNRLVSGWRPEKGTGKHARATRAGGLVQSVHRRQEALEAHAVTIPPPPQEFSFPDLTAPSGVELLALDDVGVTGRLAGPISLTLSRGDRLVVTGPNGAGKSTLLAVAAGDLKPTFGRVGTHNEARIGWLRQESLVPGELHAADVFADVISKLVARGRVHEEEAIGLSQLGLLRPAEVAKRVSELSMGQKRRLDLALVLATRPNLLLLDEPTNHLSIALVDELTEALGATEVAVVLSSHDRQLLRDAAAWPQLVLSPATG
ncbi:macrolide transport system ATP-binding/permease protein [Leucobacter komagatae]|uniref:Macrolide transport system ATP-binding/permease protein n=1 Tax=Leucobacter komagatae TaxID=55969 RepID=A0A542YA00_9MICO|nr:ABC-F family ATP-binding cassette domain-containing protein [Leucobacter komagatae]TQL44910.1 macrolide transport system ATP-binding/permease protein [Leucobacter komagatae]